MLRLVALSLYPICKVMSITSPENARWQISGLVLLLFSSNRVYRHYGACHNVEIDLCVTERECANRLHLSSVLLAPMTTTRTSAPMRHMNTPSNALITSTIERRYRKKSWFSVFRSTVVDIQQTARSTGTHICLLQIL